MSEAKATIKKIQEVFDINLRIPEYQRPYKWQVNHAQQLIIDLLKHFKQNIIYRIGTIVLYHHTNKMNNEVQSDIDNNIVDGQQRLVTLSLILHLLDYQNIKLLKEEFNHTTSHVNIYQNYEFLKDFIKDNISKEDKSNFKKYILEKCEMVCIKLEDLDEAFQFFDSQNSRGKPLESYDLLKAYHLREMKSKPEYLVLKSVANWEQAALADENTPNLSKIINQVLFRLRRWHYNLESENFTSQELNTFKGVSEEVKYPYLHTQKTAKLLSQLIQSNPNLYNPELLNLGFQINQPIINGELFFAYIEHYRKLYDELFNNKTGKLLIVKKINGKHFNDVLKENLIQFLDNYQGYSRTGDRYLRMLFENTVLTYYDKFGDVELERFVNKAFWWVYRLRFHHGRIGFKTIENHGISSDSLLKHIEKAYSPEVALQFPKMTFNTEFENTDKKMKEIFGVNV